MAETVSVHEAELTDIEAAREALDIRQAEVEKRFSSRRAELQAALREARAALR
ncbi:hypothetical protein [Phenylobacterium sp.]|uniref:hypothetical protein n=1 Tax=Phenylobacterium sp. TaxID=1871053 RepID=UPI002730E435|nr:hypothetical protein [Phenylobacterium sp.]MDP1598812.1 hypothetical protein [Phenylobacterium sp.]MDP3591061.1 hypothetical protein [Phenylobacterium sp.]